MTAALNLAVTAPAVVWAANNSAQSASPGVLQQIIVTATRREEPLQDVPISITVFNQRQLTERNVTSAADLAAYTPSLSVDNTFGSDNADFVLRGFYQQSGTSPTVAVYFDDVVAPRGGIGGALEHAGDGAGPGSFFDLQNVQVVKGPQGTLFGLNTTGGALLLVPKRPTGNFGGYIEQSFGNYGMVRTQGVLNLPISDKVRLRLGIDHESRDGYLKNVSGIGPNNLNNIGYTAGRASLVVDVTDDIENYTVASFSESSTNGPGEQVYACNPAIPIFGQLSCNQLSEFKGNAGYNVENDLPDARSFVRQWQVINTTTWQATDNLRVKNIASYARYAGTIASSLFGSDWTIPAALDLNIPGIGVIPLPTGAAAGQHLYFTASDAPLGDYISDQSTYTEELQFQGESLGNRLRWQAGYYMEGSGPVAPAGTMSPTLVNCSDFRTLQCTDLLQSVLGAPFGSVQRQTGHVTYRDYAGYGQGTYAITGKLNFTAGARFTSDTTNGSVTRDLWSFPTANLALQTCLAGVQNTTTCQSTLRNESSAPTWLVGLDYSPVKNLLTYLKYTRGYRTGGVVLGAPPGYLTFGPEHVDDYEIGEKYSFRGPVSGLIDADVFYSRLYNEQVPIGFVVPPGAGLGAPSGSISNAAQSRIEGLELDTALAYGDLSFDVSYTYLDTRIMEVTQPAQIPGSPYVPTTELTVGEPSYYSPKSKVALTASYRLPVAQSLGNLSVEANYTYTGSQLTGVPGPYDMIPPYGLVNLNLNWEGIDGGPFDAELFVTNATNKFYAVNEADYTNILGFAARSLGEPRMFGVRLRYHFGGG